MDAWSAPWRGPALRVPMGRWRIALAGRPNYENDVLVRATIMGVRKLGPLLPVCRDKVPLVMPNISL